MKIIRNNKGQALVEFAIILPILLLLIMGIVQFGMMINSYLSIQYASREGARAGIVGSTDAEIKNLIIANSQSLDASKITVTITPDFANRKSGDALTVKLSYSYNLTVPIISSMFKNSVLLNAQTSMRIE
ncbi:TadE-like protein [Clostridiales bacterium oral taxon 876 str. F0540]|nr:TadE-like protein [Clostridiales bacterium oral taxon 876 str. F0540]